MSESTTCPGCRRSFTRPSGLRAHQHRPSAPDECKPFVPLNTQSAFDPADIPANVDEPVTERYDPNVDYGAKLKEVLGDDFQITP